MTSSASAARIMISERPLLPFGTFELLDMSAPDITRDARSIDQRNLRPVQVFVDCHQQHLKLMPIHHQVLGNASPDKPLRGSRCREYVVCVVVKRSHHGEHLLSRESPDVRAVWQAYVRYPD